MLRFSFQICITYSLSLASVPSSTPTLSLDDAITKAESALGGKFNGHPATLEFIAQQDGSLALTHVMQIENDQTGAWVEAFIDAHSGSLVHITDFVAQASVGFVRSVHHHATYQIYCTVLCFADYVGSSY